MSYSKIFSDLPELTYDVIKYFKNDFSTLYSCILVNRLWCRLAIPLLWENPFLISNENYNFIGIYLRNLNGDLKAQLNEYKIDDKLFPSNTLFNYPIFLKYLYTGKIISSIEEWSKDIELENRSIPEFKRLIYISLFKIFIENEVNIYTFDIKANFPYIDDMLELILQNPDFLHNIRNLKLCCINFYTDNRMSQMINLCQNLKKISLAYNNSFPLYQTSLLSNDYNHSSNTLNTIILFRLNFKIIYSLFNLIENVKQNLNHLSINIFDNFGFSNTTELSSITLQNLGQLLPLKLEYLSLTLTIKYKNDFEMFLKNSQDTFIKKLLIKDRRIKDDEECRDTHDFILSYIKEYIMKKKRVKYLAIINFTTDLFSFKDEVKEFELYNIKIQKYRDLVVKYKLKFVEEFEDF
ncbi:unnamed protein product [Rhizophagus irregularis]|nr:unnamed protein product [Rhizophagus irregularis]